LFIVIGLFSQKISGIDHTSGTFVKIVTWINDPLIDAAHMEP